MCKQLSVNCQEEDEGKHSQAHPQQYKKNDLESTRPIKNAADPQVQLKMSVVVFCASNY